MENANMGVFLVEVSVPLRSASFYSANGLQIDVFANHQAYTAIWKNLKARRRNKHRRNRSGKGSPNPAHRE
ncbi:hypothetical protein Cob_v008954 [Colletotrichum orbiculare MAFF 240422]|uniref:Uncharacterized protein n=1 Tax=Colletotrichum orbiculare (strain 104-T / ATCC 96160 / CBS 514.97 / LARS 414 / MAFF 240422) TaxID=1213857 RepID=A0A484FKW7_COLOR|nr:hypothetical protein Cob_v008954 [Colletotrichum orbiculare MAFF 240422]